MKRSICGLLSLLFLLTLLSACAAPDVSDEPDPKPSIGTQQNVNSSYAGREVVDAPDISVHLEWEAGAAEDDTIYDTVMDFITLVFTAQARPDDMPERVPCCTDELLACIYTRAWRKSELLYPCITLSGTIGSLRYSNADTVHLIVHGLTEEYPATLDGRTMFTNEGEQWIPGYEDYWGLTLNRSNGSWQVSALDEGCSVADVDFSLMQGGVTDSHIQSVITAYFQLRATEAAGGVSDSTCTTSTLLADAREFAKTLCGHTYGSSAYLMIVRVCHADVRLDDLSTEQDQNHVRVSVKELLRLEYLLDNGKPVCDILEIDHALTLSRTADGSPWLVTGDLYRYGDHACNIVDYLD